MKVPQRLRILPFIFFLQLGQTAKSQELMLDSNMLHINVGAYGTAYNSVFDRDGERKQTTDILHGGLNLQSEVWLNSRWNLMLNAPLLIYNNAAASEAPGGLTKDESNIGVGDIEVGLRYGIKPFRKWSAAFSIWQSTASGTRDEKTFLHTGFHDYYTRLGFQVQFKQNPGFYLGTLLNFTNRNKGFSDEFQAGIYSRIHLYKSLHLQLYANGIQPFENGDEEPIIYQYGLYHNNWGIIQTGADLLLKNKSTAEFFIGANTPIRGQYIYTSAVVRLGALVKLNLKRKNSNPIILQEEKGTSQ
jgi:hypothetical protein